MKKKIIVLLVVAALAGGGITLFSGAKRSNSDNITDVIVKQASKGNLVQSVTAEGEIEISNEEDIYVSRELRIEEVLFEENDTVKKGDKLIIFDPEERNELLRDIETVKLKIEEEKLSITENEFKVSKISIETAEKEIKDLTSDIEKYGDKIRIAEIEKETLEKELENNIQEFEVNQKLFDMEGIALTELNSSEEAKDTSIKDLETKEWEIKEYKIDLATAMTDLEFANKTLENEIKEYDEEIVKRKNDIKRSEIAIKQYEIQIASYQEELEKTVEYLVSPVSGTITEVNAEENFLSDTSESLMTISDIESQVITANVTSSDINDVAVGQEVKITSDSLGEGNYITGKVEKIASLATVESGSGYQDVVVEVEVSFDSENSKLRPGYSVDLEIITSEKDNAVTIPTFAITSRNGENIITILNDDNTVSKKKVEIGIKTTTTAEILNLDGDEKIVMNGTKLRPGTKVNVVDRMTSEVGEEKERGGGPGGGGPRP